MSTQTSSRIPYDITTAWKLVLQRELSLNKGQGLSGGESGRLKRFYATHQNSKPARRLRKFLEQLDISYGPLCAIVFNQGRIYKTPQSVLDAILKKTKDRPSELSITGRHILHSSQIVLQHGQDSSKTCTPHVSPTYPNVKAVERVFCPKMVEKIKTYEKKNKGKRKKLILRFPKSTHDPETNKPLSSFLELEICQEYMGELVMTLFGMEVKRISDTEPGFRMRHESGVMLTVPCLNLEGALRGKIAGVFGEEIHSAIAACQTYKSEDGEGKNITRCVEAFWAKGEARITLEMEVIAGVHISNKLL